MFAFEFDERKSQTSLDKHGIDFIEVQELWSDPYLIEIIAKTSDEPRFLVIGRIKGKHWSADVIPRSNKIRIIAARRSRQEEVAIYES